MKKPTRADVRTWMDRNRWNYIDASCEISCTALAEGACQSFDLYEVKGPEFNVPEWLFDLAVEATEDTRH